MTRTYLVACDTSPDTDVSAFADDILESLQSDGIPAITCKPWASAITEPETGIDFQMPTLPASFLAPR